MVRTLPATGWRATGRMPGNGQCRGATRTVAGKRFTLTGRRQETLGTANGRSPALYWKEAATGAAAPGEGTTSVTTGRHPARPDMACLPGPKPAADVPTPLSPVLPARKFSATSMAGCGCVSLGTATAGETKHSSCWVRNCPPAWANYRIRQPRHSRAWVRK